MTDPDTISADYSLRPSELASTLALLVEARQPVVVWGASGCAKSQIAQQVAAQAGREYVDVRALLLDPVDLRGIPCATAPDGADRTRWAPPAFPAAVGCGRPLADQSGGTALGSCRWSRPRSISSCSTASAASTNSPKAPR